MQMIMLKDVFIIIQVVEIISVKVKNHFHSDGSMFYVVYIAITFYFHRFSIKTKNGYKYNSGIA